MRISDWSSDVCSSDLSCRRHQGGRRDRRSDAGPSRRTSASDRKQVTMNIEGFIGQIWIIVLLVIIAIFVIVVIARSIRIIPQGYAGIVERLGRYHTTLSPGLNLLVPFIEDRKSTRLNSSH